MEVDSKKNLCEWGVEVLSFVALLCTFYPLLLLERLGDVSIPIHYNISGEVDGWGSRYYLWFLPLLALVLYIGFYIIGRWYPQYINYPIKVTAQNASSVYKIGVRMLRYMKLFILLLFAYINSVTISMAMEGGDGLNLYIMIALFSGLSLTALFYSIKIMKLKSLNR